MYVYVHVCCDTGICVGEDLLHLDIVGTCVRHCPLATLQAKGFSASKYRQSTLPPALTQPFVSVDVSVGQGVLLACKNGSQVTGSLH